MENQPKLNSSKEVIAFLAERFPQCFSAEGEARPLKVGIFQDLVARVEGDEPQQNAASFCLAPLYLELALPVRYQAGCDPCRP